MKRYLITISCTIVSCFLLTNIGLAKSDVKELFSQHKENIRKGNTCLSCHDKEEIKNLIHTSQWIEVHKNSAIGNEDTCKKCHTQEYCTNCHSYKQAVKPSDKAFDDVKPSFQHRGDWLGRHSLEAEADSARCYRCHTQEYCASCHPKVDAPHPIGEDWVYNQHGEKARRNIGTCASCHEDGAKSNCITCHAPGGKGGNPHPAGWSGGRLGLDRSKDKPCSYCHKD